MREQGTPAPPPCRGCGEPLTTRRGRSRYCTRCYTDRYPRGQGGTPPPCNGCGEPLIVRCGRSRYCPACFRARYNQPYVERLKQEAGTRHAIYLRRSAHYSSAYKKRLRLGLRPAFRYMLPGRPRADPRTEPWSLGWLERLYDLHPAMMRSTDLPTRHNPEASTNREKNMPDLRTRLRPLVSPDNPLYEPEARTALVRQWLARQRDKPG